MNHSKYLHLAFFFESQQYLLPVTLLFYIQNNLGISDYILLQALSYLFYVFLATPTAYIADHFSKKHILIIGTLINMLRITLWINFSGYYIIFIGEFLFVLVRIYTNGMVDSYITEHLKETDCDNKKFSEYGKIFSYISYGSAASALLSPFIYERYGIFFLLYLELLLNIIAVILLLFIPKTKIYHNSIYSLKDIKEAFYSLYYNKYLYYLIGFIIALYSSTTIINSSIQPLLKLSSSPIFWFGCIYFLNQIIRGIFCQNTTKIINYFNIQKIINYTGLLLLLSLFCIVMAFAVTNIYFSVIALMFSCIGIGLQACNQIYAISEIHNYSNPSVRATMISFFNISIRFFGGLSILFFKNNIKYFSYSESFGICSVVIIFMAIYFLYKLKKQYKGNK